MKKEKGITLVALVVTIIILIILAGVSINAVIGENGIITLAKRAKENAELSQIEEQTELNELYDYMQDEGREEGTNYDLIAKYKKEIEDLKEEIEKLKEENKELKDIQSEYEDFKENLSDAYYKKEIPAISVAISSSHSVSQNDSGKPYSSISSSASISVNTNGTYNSQTGGGSLSDGVLSLSCSDSGSNRYYGTYSASNSSTLNGGYAYVSAAEIDSWNYPVLTITGSGAANSGNSESGKHAPSRSSSHAYTVNCGTNWKNCRIISNSGCSINFSNGILTVVDSGSASGEVYRYSRSISWQVELTP